MNAQLKSKLIILCILLLSAFVWLNMGLYIIHVSYGLQYNWGFLNNIVKIPVGFSQIHPFFHFGFYILMVYSFFRICIRIIKQIALTLKWTQYFINRNNSQLTKHILEKYRQNRTNIYVVDYPGFIAITMGIFKPRIILSSVVITQFDDQEIDAIIHHELYHQRNFDPLKIFLTTLILDSIHYIPIMKVLVHYYKICKELMADQYAISKMNTSYGLSKALIKINRIKKTTPISIGVGFTSSTINLRIQQILEPNNAIKIPLDYIRPLIQSCIIFALMSLVSVC